MKILHTVEFYAPSVGGAQEVVRQISTRLVERGHDVTVATTRLPDRTSGEIDGVEVVGFDIAGNAVRGYSGSDVDRYRAFLCETKFDIVMNYAAQEWAADIFFEVMDRVDAKKVFAPCGFSGLYHPPYADYFRRMPAIMRSYDATIFHTEAYRDSQFAHEHNIENGVLIPNGAGEDEFADLDEDRAAEFRALHRIDGLLVTTLGTHSGSKGHLDSIRAFVRADIGPATLLIIGAAPPGGCLQSCRRWARTVNLARPFTGKRVLLLDLPRHETVQALKATDIFLFLSTIECSPIVLFESAAAGVPFVTSPAGNAAEIARWTGGGVVVEARAGLEGMIVPSLESAASHLVALARDRGSRRALGAAGREAWRQRFTWERIAGNYVSLYEQLLA